MDQAIQDSSLPPKSDPHLLQNLVSILNTPWLSKFLFTSDPIHLNPLSSSLPHSPLISAIHFHRITPPPKIQLHDFNSHYLWIPVFTKANITIGVGVMDVSETLSTMNNLHGKSTFSISRNIRFVLDSNTTSMITILDSPHESQIICHNTTFTPSAETSLLLSATRFFREPFLEFVNSGTQVQLHDLLPLVSFGMVTTLKRRCLACSPNSDECQCQIAEILPAAHPFDDAQFKSSVALSCGSFSGSTSLYANGKDTRFRQNRLNTTAVIHGIYDPVRVQNMKEWALTSYARGVKHNPRSDMLLTYSAIDNTGTGAAQENSAVNCGKNESLIDEIIDQSNKNQIWQSPESVDNVTQSIEGEVDDLVSFDFSFNQQDNTEISGIISKLKNSEGNFNDVPLKDLTLIIEQLKSHHDKLSQEIEHERVGRGSVKEQLHVFATNIMELQKERKKRMNREYARMSYIRKKENYKAIEEEWKETREKIAVLKKKLILLQRENSQLKFEIVSRISGKSVSDN